MMSRVPILLGDIEEVPEQCHFYYVGGHLSSTSIHSHGLMDAPKIHDAT